MNRQTIELVKRFEGLRLRAYFCPAGVPTIGYGHTGGITAFDVRGGKIITEAEAERQLMAELHTYESGVLSGCVTIPNENQLGAMTSLAYNIGLGAFAKSSVLKAHNRGDTDAAARAFGLWNKATVGGKKTVLAGLSARRAAEAALYLVPVKAVIDMPQAVEPERPMIQSKIMSGGTITAAVSGLSIAAQTASEVASIRASLGDWMPYVVMAAAVIGLAAGVWVMLERLKQRKEGRA